MNQPRLTALIRDIDLLKCRSFAVFHRFVCASNLIDSVANIISSFTDSEVLSPNFKESLAEVARVMQPLVHWYVHVFHDFPP